MTVACQLDILLVLKITCQSDILFCNDGSMSV